MPIARAGCILLTLLTCVGCAHVGSDFLPTAGGYQVLEDSAVVGRLTVVRDAKRVAIVDALTPQDQAEGRWWATVYEVRGQAVYQYGNENLVIPASPRKGDRWFVKRGEGCSIVREITESSGSKVVVRTVAECQGEVASDIRETWVVGSGRTETTSTSGKVAFFIRVSD